jgi:regulatory protein
MGPTKAGPNRRARRPAAKLSAEALFEYAVKYLGFQACSSEALKSKLRLKAADFSDIDVTIARLKDIGYLNDARFAESYASSRVENDGFGRMRVLSDLRAKRVSAGLAEKAVANAFEEKDEPGMIDAFIERRMSRLATSGRIDDERELARAYRRLRRAGFSSGGVLTALKRLAAKPELLEEPPPDDSEPDGPE